MTACRTGAASGRAAEVARGVGPYLGEASKDYVTGVAEITLVGELLHRLEFVAMADQRKLRPIGPGGYSGGARHRPPVELQLPDGDFLSDVALRGNRALPSDTTLLRISYKGEVLMPPARRGPGRDR